MMNQVTIQEYTNTQYEIYVNGEMLDIPFDNAEEAILYTKQFMHHLKKEYGVKILKSTYRLLADGDTFELTHFEVIWSNFPK